jgi:hypothetical protein
MTILRMYQIKVLMPTVKELKIKNIIRIECISKRRFE